MTTALHLLSAHFLAAWFAGLALLATAAGGLHVALRRTRP
jgi:hypothetical protein